MPTPLCDALRAFARQDGLRMHMPGHKGKPLPVPELADAAPLDFTELAPTGNLFDGDGPIRQAEDLWSEALGMEQCLFLTGGSTQGIYAALTLCCPPGSSFLMDRGCHRAVYHAAALLDLHPEFLSRPWQEKEGVLGPISPEQVASALDAHPNCKTICITSPTYYGVLSDIPAIAAAVHQRGGKLVVDAAHGPHLFFLGDRSLSAADVVVLSAHKTLPALGQSALLMANGFSHGDLRRAAGLYGSSSPSYVMMASLDGARDYLLGRGGQDYALAAERVAGLRMQFPSLQPRAGFALDPTRLTLMAKDGPAAARRLEAAGVWPEMEDQNHVVLIVTCMDTPQDLDRLEAVLHQNADAWGMPEGRPGRMEPPPEPETVLSPRKARFAPARRLPLEQAEGAVSACQVAPYPPGVPVIAPGERVTKKALAYLNKVGYNMKQEIELVSMLPTEREDFA